MFWATALCVLALDRVTKLLVLAYLPIASSKGLGPIALTHVRNTGTFFGLGKGAGLFLGLFAGAVCVYIISEYRKNPINVQPLLALVFAGAFGNLLDRIVHGSVIDFIDLKFWPVFNIADAAITVAIVWLLVNAIRAKR